MDIEYTEEQQQLMAAARRFMEQECPFSLVREMESSEHGFSPGLWQKMADLGWLGLPFPAGYGGFGMGAVDLVVLAKELGRALCPSPYIPGVVLSGGAIAAAGTEEQRKSYLPRIISGDLIVAFALQEANGYYDPRGVTLRATKTADGFALNGTKLFVEFAGAADRIIVVARTSGAPPSTDGITMFLVDPNSAGVRLRLLSTMARDRQFEVTFEGAAVPAADVVGPLGGAWPLLEGVVLRGVIAMCGYMVGASERIQEMATDFAKQRVQFGRPIGSFQAIQHYLAQMVTEIVGAETTALYGAWTLDEGLPAREIVAKAKVLSGDTFKQASAVGSQIYGGIGFNEDVDTTLFLRRGKQYQLSMGHTGYWEDVIAEELLDA
jgi:alkylation response protein AidB-like acyl-CoA dehydrogenase